MAYDEYLADRIRQCLNEKKVPSFEKKMMGGLVFMVDHKMCVGIIKNKLMCRVGPIFYESALQRPACSEMRFTGRPLKGYVFVEAEGYDMDVDLDFNPAAKASKKRT